jgi:7,8-dihydroneopterin aldolase/epimerase/oxygenase
MKLFIKDLRVQTIIGTKKWERQKKQNVIINIEMEFDGEKAAQTDSIAHTINYERVIMRIINYVEKSHYFLIEKLATSILSIIMKDNLSITNATVEVNKPGISHLVDSVSIVCSSQDLQFEQEK